MFKQQCYIRKNTHELKNKLRLMGYNVSDSLNLMGDYIKCSNGSAECILKPLPQRQFTKGSLCPKIRLLGIRLTLQKKIQTR